MKSRFAIGSTLVVICAALNAGADAITKYFASGFEAPQLLALSSAIIVMLSLALPKIKSDWSSSNPDMMRLSVSKGNRWTMALRSALTVVAAIGFFNALSLLTLAELFLFVALMPILAAALSGPILDERPGPQIWVAVVMGCAGLYLISPNYNGLQENALAQISGFAWAGLGAGAGTISILLARKIAITERIPLAQVFWPNLAMMVSLGCMLPFVWAPMSLMDVAYLLGYASVLFGARFILIEAMRHLQAYVVTLMMNVQFVWMIGLGYLAFGNIPTLEMLGGAALIIFSGFWMVYSEKADFFQKVKMRVIPAE